MIAITRQGERNEQEQWPRDTPKCTFVFRALHSLGSQMLMEDWPSNAEDMFDNEHLPAIVDSLQKRCESGQASAAVQLPSGQMFRLTTDFATTNEFRAAILCGKVEVDVERIEAEDFRPLVKFLGTQQWLFIESMALRAEPSLFDGVLIDQDPTQMPLWSIGMAMVWVAYLSPDKMREVCSMPLEVLLLSNADGTPPEVTAARHALVGALATGSITATGRPAIGRRREIDKNEWADLLLILDRGAGSLEYSALGKERDDPGRLVDVSYCDIRIERSQVINHEWRQSSDRAFPIEDKLREPMLMAAKPLRQTPQRTRVTKIIQSLFPNGIPDRAELTDGQLVKAVGKEMGKTTPSSDTILRAADRKK